MGTEDEFYQLPNSNSVQASSLCDKGRFAFTALSVGDTGHLRMNVRGRKRKSPLASQQRKNDLIIWSFIQGALLHTLCEMLFGPC